jgi:hypothetical protein
MWGLWWNPTDNKFTVNAVSNVANGGTLGSTVLTPVAQTGTSTTAVWYQLDIDAYIDKDWTVTINWWIDGVAQTSWSFANPTSGNHTVGGSCTLNWNYDEFGGIFKMDDLVIVGDPDVNLATPLGPTSVVGLRVSGFGTHVNSGDFSDSDGGALTYTLLNDDPNASTGYLQQNVQNYDSYLEMEMDNPASTYLGLGTIYYGIDSTTASEFYWPVYAAIGGDTILITLFESSATGRVPIFPTGESLGGTGTHFTGQGNIPMKDINGSVYTNSDWVGLKLRWGYNGNIAAPTNRLTFVHAEICGLLEIVGGDHWAWTDSSTDSWQFMEV